jgi:glycine/D-amino acid oxidase-like deaminating enzyme
MSRPTRSIWYETASITPRPPLADHVATDVCVIGAGIAGLSVAYTLVKAGRRVVVLDLDQIGSGESGRTTAHLANEIDDRYATLEKAVGE